tara:strand:- start:5695 stop:5814 length:120 start_codon:yes stop_codon:yes gene_type:complete
MDKDSEYDNKPYTGEIMFHPINIITLIIKDGLIIGYTQK